MENNIAKDEVKTEAVSKATGVSKEILSVIETQNSGFLVSISRNLKVGRTASEISTIKMEGFAKSQEEALSVLQNLDNLTLTFIIREGEFYGIDPKAAPNKPSPIENK